MNSNDYFKNFSRSLIDSEPIIDISKQMKNFTPTIPTFENDCEFVKVCKYTNENCYAGAPAFINRRCDQAKINQMLSNKEIKPTTNVNISGDSNNVQVNQQGDHSNNNQNQTIKIDDIPQDLIDEFKKLIKEPSCNNRTKWSSYLKSLNEIGGTITTLIKLFELFCS